jgi:hypothetical protein
MDPGKKDLGALFSSRGQSSDRSSELNISGLLSIERWRESERLLMRAFHHGKRKREARIPSFVADI